MTKEFVLQYVKERYQTEPDYPWVRDPASAVLRHSESRKWYGLLMCVPRQRLGLTGEGNVDTLNLKCDPMMGGLLRGSHGILPAYHMNREHWITVVLSEAGEDELCALIDFSYKLTSTPGKKRTKSKKQPNCPPM